MTFQPTWEAWYCSHCLTERDGVLDGDTWTCDTCSWSRHMDPM